jgi:hypothetical protein
MPVQTPGVSVNFEPPAFALPKQPLKLLQVPILRPEQQICGTPFAVQSELPPCPWAPQKCPAGSLTLAPAVVWVVWIAITADAPPVMSGRQSVVRPAVSPAGSNTKQVSPAFAASSSHTPMPGTPAEANASGLLVAEPPVRQRGHALSGNDVAVRMCTVALVVVDREISPVTRFRVPVAPGAARLFNTQTLTGLVVSIGVVPPQPADEQLMPLDMSAASPLIAHAVSVGPLQASA